MPNLDDVRAVSPALARYTEGPLLGEVWKRPGLSPRDRSLVTLAALVARNQTIELPYQLDLALDHGVKASEISELITHLAFYAGWANATAAIVPTKALFEKRGVDPTGLPAAKVPLLPIDEAAEAERAKRVGENFAEVAPGVVQYTTDILFRDLWLRPGLAPRDRSLVTVSALVANGQVAQVPFHLNRAMDNGLTKPEVSEVMTQLAFYAGWPNVMSALPVVKEALSKREAAHMTISRAASRPPADGPAAWFVGHVVVTPLFAPKDGAEMSAGSVTFAPGARSAWHTHPRGQALVVTSGTGWVQEWGGPKQQMKAGDVVWTPPGVKHWHGASATEAVTHIAVQENLDGKAVEWLEPVTDAQYMDSARSSPNE